MGLDTVELVMEIEDEFGITFPDTVAEHCRTVNDVALFVYGQLQSLPASGTAISPRLLRFQELRRAIAERRNAPLDSISPESPVAEAIPRDIRRSLWSHSKVPLPELRRPRWARMCILFTALGTFIVFMAFFAGLQIDFASTLVLAVALAVPPFIVVTLLLRPVKRELPVTIRTIDDLVNMSFRSRSKKNDPLPGEPTFPQVLLRIRQITADQMGLPIEKVLPHSRFVEDLEMD